MPQCPKCRKEIDFLLFHVEVMGMLAEKSEIAFDTEDMDDMVDFVKEFVCPECGEMICDNMFEADDFLKGAYWVKKF